MIGLVKVCCRTRGRGLVVINERAYLEFLERFGLFGKRIGSYFKSNLYNGGFVCDYHKGQGFI